MIRSGALAASTMSESAEPLTVRRHSYPRSDQGGTRQEAILQAKGNAFQMVRDFKPYPAVAFDAKPS